MQSFVYINPGTTRSEGGGVVKGEGLPLVLAVTFALCLWNGRRASTLQGECEGVPMGMTREAMMDDAAIEEMFESIGPVAIRRCSVARALLRRDDHCAGVRRRPSAEGR